MNKIYTKENIKRAARVLGIYAPNQSRRGSRYVRKKKSKKSSYKSKPMPRKVKGLSKQVKELKRLAESDMGTHTQRHRVTWNVAALPNEQGFISVASVNASLIESVLAELRYYDPTTPTTLVQASGASGTFQKEFFFDKVYSKITIRNNYQTPCMVSAYACRPKVDTSITPLSAWQNGLTDIGAPATSSPLTFLTDSPQFRELWTIESSKKLLLDAGEQCSMASTGKKFQYDPSLFDNHALLYQKTFQSLVWHVFVTGVIAHDNVADEQGIIGAGIDLVIDSTFVVKYPAGADITYLHIDNSSSAFSNSAVVTNKPYADNQQHSVG